MSRDMAGKGLPLLTTQQVSSFICSSLCSCSKFVSPKIDRAMQEDSAEVVRGYDERYCREKLMTQ